MLFLGNHRLLICESQHDREWVVPKLNVGGKNLAAMKGF